MIEGVGATTKSSSLTLINSVIRDGDNTTSAASRVFASSSIFRMYNSTLINSPILGLWIDSVPAGNPIIISDSSFSGNRVRCVAAFCKLCCLISDLFISSWSLQGAQQSVLFVRGSGSTAISQQLQLTRCVFESNTASAGGIVVIDGVQLMATTIRFTSNSCRSGTLSLRSFVHVYTNTFCFCSLAHAQTRLHNPP